MIRRLTTKLNAIAFFGEALGEGDPDKMVEIMLISVLAGNPEFLDAAEQFPMDIFVTSEIIRLLPYCLSR